MKFEVYLNSARKLLYIFSTFLIVTLRLLYACHFGFDFSLPKKMEWHYRVVKNYPKIFNPSIFFVLFMFSLVSYFYQKSCAYPYPLNLRDFRQNKDFWECLTLKLLLIDLEDLFEDWFQRFHLKILIWRLIWKQGFHTACLILDGFEFFSAKVSFFSNLPFCF